MNSYNMNNAYINNGLEKTIYAKKQQQTNKKKKPLKKLEKVK